LSTTHCDRATLERNFHSKCSRSDDNRPFFYHLFNVEVTTDDDTHNVVELNIRQNIRSETAAAACPCRISPGKRIIYVQYKKISLETINQHSKLTKVAHTPCMRVVDGLYVFIIVFSLESAVTLIGAEFVLLLGLYISIIYYSA